MSKPPVYRSQLEFVKPRPEHREVLAAFFRRLAAGAAASHFHPHPFTEDAVRERCEYRGQDVYCLALVDDVVLGYGMLRGWDQGYTIPSLGIAVDSEARDSGLGRALMLYLHAEARRRGAPRIRLKVYPANQTAVDLYRNLGYEFGDEAEQGQLVGFKDLSRVKERGRGS
jgi:ribosomal protein S18 acetylase RimI-like enzyme